MDIIKTQTDYRYLEEPMENPHPDRRTTGDWTKNEEFPKGLYRLISTTYRVEDCLGGLDSHFESTEVNVRCLSGEWYRNLSSHGGEHQKAQYEAILGEGGLRTLTDGDSKELFIQALMDEHDIDNSDLRTILARLLTMTKTPMGKLAGIVSDYEIERREKHDAEYPEEAN
jgi:hypothetical protein